MKKLQGMIQCFIGQQIEIVESSNKSLVGLSGTIINETKETFEIKTSTKRKTVVKNQITFTINNKKICGKDIIKTNENRIKLRIKNE